MLDQLLNYFLERPRRLIAVGRAVVITSGHLLLLGVIAHAATSIAGVVHGLAGQSTDVTLAAILPGLPTWWVPEGAAGFLFAGIGCASGLFALHTGRIYERLLCH